MDLKRFMVASLQATAQACWRSVRQASRRRCHGGALPGLLGRAAIEHESGSYHGFGMSHQDAARGWIGAAARSCLARP